MNTNQPETENMACRGISFPEKEIMPADAMNRENFLNEVANYLYQEGASGTHALMLIALDAPAPTMEAPETDKEELAGFEPAYHRLRDSFRVGDIFYPIGAGRLAVLVKRIALDRIAPKAKLLIESFLLDEGGTDRIDAGLSIGIAVYDGARLRISADALLKEAEGAFIKAKAQGKNAHAFADSTARLFVSNSHEEDILHKAKLNLPTNLFDLLDYFANGIAIFRGMPDGSIEPLFCNARLPELLGITKSRFYTHMAAKNFYGIHPDDYDRARTTLLEAVESGDSLRDTFRLRTGSGDYRYVTSFVNVHPEAGGSYLLYCIFSDAEETEYIQYMEENRRRRMRKKRTQAEDADIAYVLINVTKDRCSEYNYRHATEKAVNVHGTATDCIASIAELIPSDKHKAEFLKRFSMKANRQDLQEGILTKEMRLPLLLRDYGVRWYSLTVELSYNPNSGDIEAFYSFFDVDNEVRLGYVVDRILEREYEYLCQIDVRSGYLTRLKRNDEDDIDESENGRVRYDDRLMYALERLLPEEYLDEGKEALALERVMQVLSERPVYNCVFPARAIGERAERVCQWNFEYVDKMQSTILMTRSNISTQTSYGFDAVTGMHARNDFYRCVREELDRNPDKHYHLVEVDFDNFKIYNQEQGYGEGDRLLRRFGADIRRFIIRLQQGSHATRLEADHFAFFFPTDSGISPEMLFHRLNKQLLGYPNTNRLKLRMGVYEIVDHKIDVALMCDCAHLAHKYCKHSFSNSIKYYSADLTDKMLDEQMLITEAQHALDSGQFELRFQPQVNHTTNGTLIGAEVLVRWNHPLRGMISPALFIPLFEQNGFIYEVDKYVWEQSCKELRRVLDNEVDPLPFSVNVSRVDMMQTDFLDTITGLMDRYRIPYRCLHLEVTESAFSDDTGRIVSVVKELIDRGFVVAIDDFGSGYSSLNMLRKVPAHILKLDMRFFEDDKVDAQRSECIVQSIVHMAKILGMAVIAEGVETVEQADNLSGTGCHYIQGYLYSKPLTHKEFQQYIVERGKLSPNDHVLIKPDGGSEALSNRLFRDIITGSQDIIIVADSQTKRLLYANHAAETYYDKSFEPMAGITCADYCNNDKHCTNCPVAELAKGEYKERIHFDNNCQMRTQYSHMDWNGHEAFVCYQTDITSELELTDALIRNIPGAIIAFCEDANGLPVVRYVSERAMSLFWKAGLRHGKPNYEELISIIHPDDRSRVKKAFIVAFRRRAPLREEFRICFMDDTVMWIELLIDPVADKNNDYTFYSIFTDITDRRMAQAKSDQIVTQLPVAMTVFDSCARNSKCIYISARARAILGLEDTGSHRMDMKDYYKCVHPEDVPRMRRLDEYCMENKAPVTGQFRVKGESGEYRWVQIDTMPIQRDNGAYLFYGIYTDINATKSAEPVSLCEGCDKPDSVKADIQRVMRDCSAEAAIHYILSSIGGLLCGRRSFIVVRDANGSDTRPFEWAVEGLSPEGREMEVLDKAITDYWYQLLRDEGMIFFTSIDEVAEKYPIIYPSLKKRDESSMIVVPFFDVEGAVQGFFGLSNPSKALLQNNVSLVQHLGHFIEELLPRCKYQN